MKYIYTEHLSVYVLSKQKKRLKQIQSEILNDYNIKIPVSELVRQALDYGLNALDNEFIIKELEAMNKVG